MKENTTDNIKVLVRVRPFDHRENNSNNQTTKCVFADEISNVIELKGKTNNAQGTFKFDFVRNEQSSQRAIFSTIGESVVEKFLEGFHGCVIAYGQTGAGKTYTMQGFGDAIENEGEDDAENNKSNDVGLIPRALRRIFEFTKNTASDDEDVTHEVTCAYLEIYNEQLTDLLSSGDGNGDCIAMDGMMVEDSGNNTGSIPSFGSFSGGELAIREDPKKGTFVENLTKVKVNSAEETYEAFLRGSARRRVGETEMNRNSSRSHSVFSVTLTSTTRGRTTKEKKRTLHLVDLAGSERQKATEATGARLKEASAINKSLSALGNVIKSLVDVANGRDRHVAFRDSKLTWLLKDALGGNAKCAVIACVSPALINADETASTLKFANRAKLVKVRAQVNERAFHNHMNFGNTPYKSKANSNNNNTNNNATAMDAEVTRLRAMIDEIVATTTTTKTSSSSAFLAAALGEDARMEEGGENSTSTASSKIAELVLNGMKRASALEKNILETNRANLVWQRDAVAKQAHLESKVNDLNELVERLEQNISSTQMVLKLREASLKKHGIDKDDVDRELLELRKIVSVPPEVVKLRMELARVTEGLERAEAEASSSHTKGEYARMVEELNCMRAVNVEQSELASTALEQKLWFEKEKIALLENLREVESKVELAELRAVDAEANQFRAENAKSEAERAYIESQKITDDAVKEKVRVESTFAENKQVMEEMFARLEEETKKRDEMETECQTLREASQTMQDQMLEKGKELDAFKEKLQVLEAEAEKSKSALRDSESSLQNALGKQNDLASETENKLKASEMEFGRQKEEMMQEKIQMQKSMEEEIAKARKASADEIAAMKVKLDEETTLAIEAVKAEKETMFDTLKRMELEMQTLRETTDERVQTAENVAKEKLALELKALEEETERVTKERANLEASFDAKRAELERSFEEKEHLVTSTCEMKVAASKAAAASEFKAAAALQLKVKDLTRKLEEMKDSNNKSDNAMVATATTTTHTTTTASTPTPVKATTTTTNTSLLLKSGGARRVLQPLNHHFESQDNEDDREDDHSFHASKKPRTLADADDDENPRSPLVLNR